MSLYLPFHSTAPLIKQTATLTDIPKHIVEDVVLHQFAWLKQNLEFPTATEIKLLRLGTFSLHKRITYENISKIISRLKRKDSYLYTNSNEEKLTKLLNNLLLLRHYAKKSKRSREGFFGLPRKSSATNSISDDSAADATSEPSAPSGHS